MSFDRTRSGSSEFSALKDHALYQTDTIIKEIEMHVENTDYLGGVISLLGILVALYSFISWRLTPAEKRKEKTRKIKIWLMNGGSVATMAGIGIIFQIAMFVIGSIFMAFAIILFYLWFMIIMDPNFRDAGLTSDPKVPKMKRDALEQFLVGYIMVLSYFGVNALENWL